MCVADRAYNENMMTNWIDNLGTSIATAGAALFQEQQDLAREERARTTKAHARTGTYNGTVERRIRGLMREFPKAETLCGGEPTEYDHTIPTATAIITNAEQPFLDRMCETCRARLEERGVKNRSGMTDRRGTMTGAQRDYLKALMREATVHRFASYLDYHHLEGVSMRAASAEIDRLKAAKSRGWK